MARVSRGMAWTELKKYDRALADYNKALSQLALNEGSTLEKNHLSVDDR